MVICGDCLYEMGGMGECSIDAIVTDPPYGWSFMGKKWDYDVPRVEVWRECLRVLKPGGHMLVACGTRTQHRMAVNIEDAGFEIRDVVAWIYGSGFPKSLNIGKAIDKMQGWGTALKPAMELWTLARKPLQGTVASNVLKWGTGGINVDGCRVGTGERFSPPATANKGTFNCSPNSGVDYTGKMVTGRFPANVIHDGSDEVVSGFPNGASRFYYTAKASKAERNMGLEGFDEVNFSGGGGVNHVKADAYGARKKGINFHPTVKPVSLMRYLCRLITPPKGTVLDPFMGSGTTGIACKMEGFEFIGIEKEEEYCKIAEARIKSVQGGLI